ncbi:MAG: glucose-1-phosphate adenylyltransferase [Planctomycetota bacterium]|nr:glucose-1-phosphate adenylyltransferase [Planctomycetota bacterium]MDA1252488.1 glucose-1-phosphate adenylyltransferase [Planctomycetota bacterium]
MKNVVCLILGGGQGTRLYPLTEHRSKPAVPLAGNYRLIDIPISNCLNCGIDRIYLLTQFNSVSLHRHIRQTYKFDTFGGGFVEILAAQQTMSGSGWYQGTADAVRQQLQCIKQPGIDYVLVLSGDQLYRMDFEEMLKTHRDANADATIATLPVTDEQARGFGVMRVDDDGRVHGFLEKPQQSSEMDMMRTDPDWIDARGIPSHDRSLLASMGIYLFKRNTLVELLEGSEYRDFGREVFPLSIRARRVHVHLFDGYWEDIGTIRAFYDANLALAGENPPFDLFDDEAPIYTRPRFLAPARILDATVRNSLVANGSLIESGSIVENCVVGVRTRIGRNAEIRDSIIMGLDRYDDRSNGGTPQGIGEGSIIRGAIIDKGCRIGRGVRIEPRDGLEADCDIKGVHIRDGIIVVPKNAVLSDGWTL